MLGAEEDTGHACPESLREAGRGSEQPSCSYRHALRRGAVLHERPRAVERAGPAGGRFPRVEPAGIQLQQPDRVPRPDGEGPLCPECRWFQAVENEARVEWNGVKSDIRESIPNAESVMETADNVSNPAAVAGATGYAAAAVAPGDPTDVGTVTFSEVAFAVSDIADATGCQSLRILATKHPESGR